MSGALIIRERTGRARIAPLPEGAFKPGPEIAPPDLAAINAGQGDARSKIRPNVKWPDAPSVTRSEAGDFVRLSDWLPASPNAADVELVLLPQDDPLLLDGRLIGVARIALYIPRASDGRSYSSARLLRQRLRYSARMRAIGDVTLDQLFFLSRCGFDEFALRGDQDARRAAAALETFPLVYQTAADERPAHGMRAKP
jgi:uncharacterized protein (DUF934 family)